MALTGLLSLTATMVTADTCELHIRILFVVVLQCNAVMNCYREQLLNTHVSLTVSLCNVG